MSGVVVVVVAVAERVDSEREIWRSVRKKRRLIMASKSGVIVETWKSLTRLIIRAVAICRVRQDSFGKTPVQSMYRNSAHPTTTAVF